MIRPSDSKGPGTQFQEVRGEKGAPSSEVDLNCKDLKREMLLRKLIMQFKRYRVLFEKGISL